MIHPVKNSHLIVSTMTIANDTPRKIHVVEEVEK